MAQKAEAEEENNRFWKEKHLGFINKVARAYNPSELTETQYDFVEKQNELFNSRPKERQEEKPMKIKNVEEIQRQLDKILEEEGRKMKLRIEEHFKRVY